MKKKQPAETSKFQTGPIFKARERKKPYSGRMSPYAFDLLTDTAAANKTSISEVIESCVLYALDKKWTV